jgi:hypothetical protein
MSRVKNEPVGDCECPIKGCTKSVAVHKYRDASGDPLKRRFAGRLYCICEAHGRVENQEFLLEYMTWRNQNAAPVAALQDESRTPAQAPVTPAKAPEPSESKTPAKPAPAPVVTPAKPHWLPEFFK